MCVQMNRVYSKTFQQGSQTSFSPGSLFSPHYLALFGYMIHFFQPNFSLSNLYLFFFFQTTKTLFFCTEVFWGVSEAGGINPQVGFRLATFYFHHFISRSSPNPEPQPTAFIGLLGMVVFWTRTVKDWGQLVMHLQRKTAIITLPRLKCSGSKIWTSPVSLIHYTSLIIDYKKGLPHLAPAALWTTFLQRPRHSKLHTHSLPSLSQYPALLLHLTLGIHPLLLHRLLSHSDFLHLEQILKEGKI